jgi:hypothetical protein
MKRRIRVSALVSLLFASAASAQFGTEPAVLDLIKVRDDVYVIHNEIVPGNVTALITEFGFQDFHIQLSLDGLMVELR